MYIDITDFVRNVEACDLSASKMELGNDAGKITWNNAKAEAALHPLFSTDAEIEACRAWAEEFGAWDRDEIAAWSSDECNALVLECGDSNAYASWTVARGRKENGTFVYDDAGKPFLERHSHSENKARYSPIPDRETGAKRRLAKLMARYPTLTAYIQGDPRGAALYILRPGDVPEGKDADACYSRGIPVCR